MRSPHALALAALGMAACQGAAPEPAADGAMSTAAALIAKRTQPAPDVSPRDATPATRDAPEGYRIMKPVLRTGSFGHAVLLLDADAKRFVPIFIGGTEALSIQLRLSGETFSRPLTHDLFDRFAKEMNAKMVRAQVDRIVDGVYIGTVVFERADGELFSLDARTSDAIALAIGNHVPILVAEPVLTEAGVEANDLGDDGAPQGPRPDNPVEL